MDLLSVGWGGGDTDMNNEHSGAVIDQWESLELPLRSRGGGVRVQVMRSPPGIDGMDAMG